MSYLWNEGLTPELIKKAEIELGETPEVRSESLKQLRKLINSEADFKPRVDDAFLLRFLRVRKFNVANAYRNLQSYYVYKARYRGLLTDFKPTEVMKVLEMNNMCQVSKKHPSGALISIVRPGLFNNDVTGDDMIAAFLVAAEVVLEYEASQICGCAVIIDLEGLTLRKMLNICTPTRLYRAMRAVKNCYPFRFKGLHFVNEPIYFPLAFSIVKPFFSEKDRKRIHMHGRNLKSFHQFIPEDILPTELGGTDGPLSDMCQQFCKQVISREEIMDRQNKFGFLGKAASFLQKQDSKTIFGAIPGKN